MNSSRWLSRPARCGFISTTIDEEVGIFPVIAFLLSTVPSRREDALEALPLVFLSFGHPRMLAAMASKVLVLFVLLVTHLVRGTSPNDLGSDLTILINNDLLGTSRSAPC